MTFSILVTEPSLAPAGTRVLGAAGCRVFYLPREGAAAAQVDVLASEKIDAIIARGLPITAEAIGASKTLKVVSRHGVGYNHVDVPAATAAGVAVLIAVGSNAQSVAELAIGFMVAVARGFFPHDAAIKAGGWHSPATNSMQLSGKTLGLIGVGNVGRKVARLGLAIGMKVVALDPYVGADLVQDGVEMVSSLEALLDRADVLSPHCPLTPETEGLIGAKALARLRPGSIVINTSRGPVLDEAALIQALESGHISGAGLDTFEEEPLPPGSAIARAPNVILTPHIGGSTAAALAAVSEMAADSALRVLRGEAVAHGVCVNPEVLGRMKAVTA